MKYQMIVAALLLAGVFFRCTPAAEVSSPASFEVDSVRSFTASFRVVVPPGLEAAIERQPLAGKIDADLTPIPIGAYSIAVGLYLPDTDWSFTLLTRPAKTKTWNRVKNLRLKNRSSIEFFRRLNPLMTTDTVSIVIIDVLPLSSLNNTSGIVCQSAISGWSTTLLVPETSSQGIVSWHATIEPSNFYQGIVTFSGQSTPLTFVMKGNRIVNISAVCPFPFEEQDRVWRANGVTLSVLRPEGGDADRLHISLPPDASVQMRTCVGCLD